MPNNSLRKRFVDGLQFIQMNDNLLENFVNRIEDTLRTIFRSEGRQYSKYNPFGTVLNALKDIQLLNNINLVDAVNENNVLTADFEGSVIGIAANRGFQAINTTPASGTVRFSIRPSLLEDGYAVFYVGRNLQLRGTANGLIYNVRMSNDMEQVKFDQENAYFEIMQGEINNFTFTGTGEDRQIQNIRINQKQIYIDSVEVRVENVLWTRYERLTDIPFNGQGYLIKQGNDNDINIIFGNSRNGAAPPDASTISISCRTSSGAMGNVNEGDTFEILAGITDVNGMDIDVSSHVTVLADVDFINGYDGDVIEDIRNNIGSQSTNNIISHANHIRSYFRRFPQFLISEVYTLPNQRRYFIHVLPNIRHRAQDYFTLSENDFMISQRDRDNIIEAIRSENKYLFLSDFNIIDYTIINYGMVVFVKQNVSVANRTRLRNDVINAVNQALFNEFGDNVRKINRNIIAREILRVVQNLETVEVGFVGDNTYIDSIGDIDTTTSDQRMVPIITTGTYNNQVFETPVKVMIPDPNTAGRWSEI